MQSSTFQITSKTQQNKGVGQIVYTKHRHLKITQYIASNSVATLIDLTTLFIYRIFIKLKCMNMSEIVFII